MAGRRQDRPGSRSDHGDGNHPFYVAGVGFVEARQLGIGCQIVTRAGPKLVVKRIDWQTRPEGYLVYNFEVADDHTYFVGQANGGAWVHNPDIDCARAWKGKAWHGPKPEYENPGQHDITSPGTFRGGGPGRTELLPEDAEEVYRTAIPDPESTSPYGNKTWYGRNAEGVYYRYQQHGPGVIHWNGSSASPHRPIRPPNYIIRRFERR